MGNNKGIENAQIQYVSRCTKIVMMVGGALVIAAFGLWIYLYNHSLNTFFNIFPGLLGSLVGLAAAIVGVQTINEGAFNGGKGGTKYYSKLYGRKKLQPVLNSYFTELQSEDKKVFDNYDNITKYIHELFHQEIVYADNTKETQYRYLIYIIQESDPKFLLIWNDYNYLEAKVKKSIKDQKYLFELQKYIYYKVFNLSKKTD